MEKPRGPRMRGYSYEKGRFKITVRPNVIRLQCLDCLMVRTFKPSEVAEKDAMMAGHSHQSITEQLAGLSSMMTSTSLWGMSEGTQRHSKRERND